MEIAISDSEYADNTAFTFDSREECEKMTPLIIKQFARWGLEVLVGTEEKESKSEILFCAKKIRDVIQILQNTTALIYLRSDGEAVFK